MQSLEEQLKELQTEQPKELSKEQSSKTLFETLHEACIDKYRKNIIKAIHEGKFDGSNRFKFDFDIASEDVVSKDVYGNFAIDYLENNGFSIIRSSVDSGGDSFGYSRVYVDITYVG